MRRLLARDVTRAEVAAAIEAQIPTLSSAEEAMNETGPAPSRFFLEYRRRVPLAHEAVALLGANSARHPPTFEAPQPGARRPELHQPHAPGTVRCGLAARLGQGDGWLGFRYVVEGASLGGALIARHLDASLASPPTLRFFDPNGNDRLAVWRAVCAMLEHELKEPARLACAAGGAAATFDALIAAMEDISP